MRTFFIAALAMATAATHAQGPRSDFEANFAQAQANARTEVGAKYDQALSDLYESMPGFTAKVTKCLQDNPGHHAVRGYFRFMSAKDYEVVLEPRDGFTFCLSPALAGPSLPAPPTVPYLNPFTFTTDL